MDKETRAGMKFDGRDWATQFMEKFGQRKEDIDESLMIAWFSNALMHGYDVAMARSQNYTADKVEAPTQVTFYNSRVVTILHGIDGNAYLDVSIKVTE